MLDIQSLARKNSATLGFLPIGGFDEYGLRKCIVAAVNIDGELLGYQIHRVAKNRATLVHLCVADHARGNGIAGTLFGDLVDRTRHLTGILVTSRRDFESDQMWPRLGFAAISEKRGRGKQDTTLTRWWYDHGQTNLFSYADQSTLDVVIDANVFYDIHWPDDQSEESCALTADWLSNEIRLCVTSELFNEINRLDDPSRAEKRRYAHEYHRVQASSKEFQDARRILSLILESGHSVQNDSDLNHIAHAVSSKSQIFITLDGGILKHRTEIETSLGLHVLRPSDLIIELDEIRNRTEYQPSRFKGSLLTVSRVSQEHTSELPSQFTDAERGERESAFRQLINRLLADTESNTSQLILRDGVTVAVMIITQTYPGVIDIPLFRIKRGILASTFARVAISLLFDISIKNKISMLRICDKFLAEVVEDALPEAGFFLDDAVWTKINVYAIGHPIVIEEQLRILMDKLGHQVFKSMELPALVNNLHNQSSVPQILQAEQCMKPAKLLAGNIPAFVLPIKPQWAVHLFDARLADQTLFGAREDLMLSWENVYYRYPNKPSGFDGTFRILWYVSGDRRYLGSGAIRAYSLATNAEILPASDAYRKFKRLGIYDWRDVSDISKKSNGNVMAINFRDIELFSHAVSFAKSKEIIKQIEKRNITFQGPTAISEDTFATIYRTRISL